MLLCPPEWSDPGIMELAEPDLPEASDAGAAPPEPAGAREPAAPAPWPDHWELRGEAILRRIRAPRAQLFCPSDDVIGISAPVDKPEAPS
eukprot:9409986-Pyramimonas_sp.AAC.1